MNRVQRLENLSASFDGELSTQDESTLRAWLAIHPEDVREFAPTQSVIALVRGLPDVEPPSDIAERILRAAAATVPVSEDRETAIDWLDGYFAGELTKHERAVVDHYLLVDPSFAEQAKLHAAMFEALHSLSEEDPPSDLRSIPRASAAGPMVGNRKTARSISAAKSSPQRTVHPRRAPVLPDPSYGPHRAVGTRRAATLALLAALLLAVGWQAARPRSASDALTPGAPPVAHAPTGNPTPVSPAPPAGSQTASSADRTPAQPIATPNSSSVVVPTRQPTGDDGARRPAPPAATTTNRNPEAPSTVQPNNRQGARSRPERVVRAAPATPAAESVVRRAPLPAPLPAPEPAPIEAGGTGLAADTGASSVDSTESRRVESSSSGRTPTAVGREAYRQLDVPPF